MSMTETDTSQDSDGLWADIFARLEVGLDSLSRQLRRRNTLDAWAREIPQRWPVSVPAVAGTVNVVAPALWTPPEGYWWKVRGIRVLGPKAANGTEVAIATVNTDVYVTGPGAPGNVVPSSGDWILSSGTSATAGGVPVAMDPGDKEVVLQNGDQLVLVLSGAGVANTVFVASLQVSQYQGLSGFSASEASD